MTRGEGKAKRHGELASVARKHPTATLAISALAMLLLALIVYGFVTNPESIQRGVENFKQEVLETFESMPPDSLIPIPGP